MYKYPWIPKEYYSAVIFACKMIRDNGYFNKAINTAANYYGVNAEKLSEFVRERQSAGQKGKKRGNYKHYRFKGKADLFYGESQSFFGTHHFDETFKALNESNARKQLDEKLLEGYDPWMANYIYTF